MRQFNLGLLSVIALGIGSIVGAGIFALLGQVILMAGNLTYYSFAIGGIVAMMCGYSYAKLASAYPHSGGLTDYYRAAFKSRVWAGSFSLVYFVTSAVSICMIAKSFGIYMNELLPSQLAGPLSVNLFAGALVVFLGFFNMMSTSEVGKTELLLVSLKVGILLVLILAAFKDFSWTLPSVNIHPTVTQFLGSIGITFFAYAGFGVITNASADVENPQKTITHAIYGTLGIVMLLYISLAFVILNFVPVVHLTSNADVAVTMAAKELLGQAGYILIYIAAFIAFVTGISATFFSLFRISRSLGRQEILPHFYVEKFWRHGSYGNLLTVVLITLATVSFDFNAIVNVASGAFLFSYLAIFMANWKLRKQTKANPFWIWAGFTLMLFVLIAFIISLVLS